MSKDDEIRKHGAVIDYRHDEVPLKTFERERLTLPLEHFSKLRVGKQACQSLLSGAA
jgi:hypothetical protein